MCPDSDMDESASEIQGGKGWGIKQWPVSMQVWNVQAEISSLFSLLLFLHA